MGKYIEGQREQWPHRVAQLSYEDTMAYIDQALAAGQPEDKSDYSTDYRVTNPSEGRRHTHDYYGVPEGMEPKINAETQRHYDQLDRECQSCGESFGEHHQDKRCPVYGRDESGAPNYDDLQGFGVTKFSRLSFRCRIAMPQPTTLQLSNQQPEDTGSHGMAVYEDHQGDWSLKQPKPSLAFTVPLEAAASTLQRKMGLEAPESYAIDHGGRPAVVSKWYPNSSQAFQKPPPLESLHPDDQMTIQKNHVLDWLIGNHDSHVGNWIRTQDGQLVSIDKGQSAKYFGHDRLDPSFHPNYYARPPIYNRLWNDHAQGRGQMHDPRTGELGQFVKKVQSMPDEELKGLFRPYAQAAAQSGLLLNPDGDPDRRLGPRRHPANDPEAFLHALVQRKNNLHNDLGDYYDRMSRGHHIVGSADPVADKFLATWWYDNNPDDGYGMYFNSPGNAHRHMQRMNHPRDKYRVHTTPGNPMHTEQDWPGGQWNPDDDQFDPRQINAGFGRP
jgi:hypothetical protein